MVHGSALLTNETLVHACGSAPNGGSRCRSVDRAKALLLWQLASAAAQRLAVSITAGLLRLRGSVPNFYLKQVAQSLLLSMKEAPQVQNELVVGPSQEPDQTR